MLGDLDLTKHRTELFFLGCQFLIFCFKNIIVLSPGTWKKVFHNFFSHVICELPDGWGLGRIKRNYWNLGLGPLACIGAGAGASAPPPFWSKKWKNFLKITNFNKK